MSEVASLELCEELYELTGWTHTEDHRFIEKVWIESFSTSEMGQGHPDYDKTPPKDRKRCHVGEYRVSANPRNQIGIPENVPWGWANKHYEETVKRSVPAYTLGYLLRKLPSFVWSAQYEQKAYLWQRKDPDHYMAWYYVNDPNYGEDITSEHGASGETPEDALCKLAIELARQGLLEKEGK